MHAQALRLLKTTYSRVMQVSILNMQAPLNWIDEYVSKKVIGYGTAADEKINSIKDYRNLILYARKQAINKPYKATIITPFSPIFSGDDVAIFKDEMVVVIGRGKQAHKIALWMTTTFAFKQNKWQLISFHGSAPDSYTSSEDTFHIKEAEKKMQVLQMEVAKRTEELSKKNDELKIEAALERVRTVAMAMQQQEDMLQICEIITDQLLQLGVKEIRNVQTAIFYPSKGTYMNYEYYAKHGKTFITEVDFKNHKIQLAFARKMLKGPNEEVLEELKGKKLLDWYTYQKSTNQFADKYLIKAHSLNYYWYSLGPVALGISTYYPLTNFQTDLFKRFVKVFELAYRRYLDIEKAEAQTREAEIELAIERVRARSLAMHKSDEIMEVVTIIAQQINELAVAFDSYTILIIHDNTLEYWISNQAKTYTTKLVETIDFANQNKANQAVLKHLKTRTDFSQCFNYKDKNQHWLRLFKQPDFKAIPEERKKFILKQPYYNIALSFASKVASVFVRYNPNDYTSEDKQILKRFNDVFNQAYTRFLDLQKAEEQARESEIQLALERVRARTLAMRRSDELAEVSFLLNKQVNELGIPTRGCAFNIYNEHDSTEWFSNLEGTLPTYKTPREKVFLKYFEAGLRGETLFIEEFSKNQIKQHYEYLFSLGYFGNSQNKKDTLARVMPKSQVDHVAYFKYGYLLFITLIQIPDAHDIFKRFAKEFEQTYTRFLDLQKAEVQAREAQIEAALERVRGRSMAMHSSQELKDVALELRKQMGLIGQKDVEVCAIHLYDDENSFESWSAMRSPKKEGEILQTQARFPIKGIQIVDELMQHRKLGIKDYILVNEGEKSKEWLTVLKKYAPALHASIIQSIGKQLKSNWTVADFSGGALVMVTYGPPDLQSRNLLRRSANVFEQAYVRFLDLQKAEEQTREAQIETALERVRSKTMAMHNSADVGESVATLFKELMGLGVLDKNNRCGIGIMHPNEVMEAWTASKYDEGNTELTIGQLDMTGHPLLQGVYKGWQLKHEIFQYQLKGADKQRYFNTISNQLNYKLNRDTFSLNSIVVNTSYYFNEGCLYVFSDEIFSIEKSNVFARFASVFGQTYRRYLDLQKAEANALEALRGASLDRVRAEIASMRTTADLEKITPLIWKELTVLKIPFVRCGVFIMDEPQQMIHTFLSTPDGKAIAALHLPYHSSPLDDSIDYWRAKKLYQVHWKFDTYAAFANVISNQGNSINKKQYLNSVPKEGIHLHLIPFLQGMLYVGNTAPLSEGDLSLIQSVADAFSTAYARYEDFTKLDDAKKQIEFTLDNLQAAQKQLIQSEKMASLGELTAGIAHEIQNPLNFVNNFSDVSQELIDEMKVELAKGDINEAKLIANDVKQNLEKIAHHGRRADAIVKGMLQHSRTSTGKKESIDINALCDEYLRLAFHGLRAKDNSFNAKLVTDFDSTIEKIQIQSQEMGRVILNLINNALYAVGEKRKQFPNDFEPKVAIRTKRNNQSIEISVEDNGMGIPASIKDKIFQPFFTTKPTGQGTGLGLSLSYDIVKAHGGELKVETKEGEGSTFIMQLPLQ